jgi:hypothetical protein
VAQTLVQGMASLLRIAEKIPNGRVEFAQVNGRVTVMLMNDGSHVPIGQGKTAAEAVKNCHADLDRMLDERSKAKR